MIFHNNNKILNSNNRIVQSGIIKPDLFYFNPENYIGGTTLFDTTLNRNWGFSGGVAPIYNGSSFNLNGSNFAFIPDVVFPIADSGSLGLGHCDDFTFSLWFKTSGTIAYQYPFRILGNGNFEMDVNDKDGGGIFKDLWIYANSGGNLYSRTQVPPGSEPIGGGDGINSCLIQGIFFNYTFTRTAGTIKHYIDGVDVSSHFFEDGGLSVTFIRGGTVELAQQNFTGSIGKCYGYSRGLNPAEVNFNYNLDKNKYK